ncbi:MAG: DUF1697 domain-containing protein [Fimbriimonadaceae bacterium]|nr:DUF1697 domain-containing protein [Fimbriimonadaceae bacterium]
METDTIAANVRRILNLIGSSLPDQFDALAESGLGDILEQARRTAEIGIVWCGRYNVLVARFVGLIRGINVGGNNLIKMADFRAFLAEIGLTRAQTLLQSGNFVFKTETGSTAELEELLRTEASQRLSLNVQFYVRSEWEWMQMIGANPFPDSAKDDPSHLLVFTFVEPPSEEAIQEIREVYSGPESYKLVGGYLYACFPVGIGVSKLSEHKLWKKLTAQATGRNWNTVLKLAALMGEA